MAYTITNTTGAADQFATNVESFTQLANDTIIEAQDALDDMAKRIYVYDGNAIRGNYQNWGVNYNLSDYEIPEWNFSIDLTQYPKFPLNLNTVTPETVEDFTGSPPAEVSPSIPNAPNTPLPAAPGPAPEITDLEIPDIPSIKEIDDPTQYAINLPLAPILNLPTFTGSRPVLGTTTQPDADFQWYETSYDSALLQKTTDKVSTFLDGGVGIPAEIWNFIWERQNDQEYRAGAKLIDEINETWASRGFTLPTGTQAAQIAEAQENIRKDAVSRSRDIAIEYAKHEIENLRFAVQQGIALENIKGGWYQQMQARLLDAAKFSYQLAIEVLNAEIALFNAKTQAYVSEAQVYKTLIEAELAELEIYKTELEGQKLINDINAQQVQIFSERVRAETTKIEQYNAVINGLRVQSEIQQTRIDSYRATVQAYGERIKAVGLTYENYKTQMTGAKIESDIYDTSVRAYTARIQAYAAKVDANAKVTANEIDVNKLKLQEFSTKVDAYGAQLQSEVAQLDARVKEFQAQVQAYNIPLENERNRVQTELENIKASMEWAQQLTQVSITNATQYSEAQKAQATLGAQMSKAIAEINAAIAGSAMSALNVSSQISDSATTSASA